MNKIDTGIQARILLWTPVFISPGWELGLDFQYYILYETLLPVLLGMAPFQVIGPLHLATLLS